MGIVFQANKGILELPAAEFEERFREQDLTYRNALIQPGQDVATIKAAELTKGEVEMIMLKLDQMAMSTQHEGIANMVAEEFESILTAIRMVKTETKEPFRGLLGFGAQLDIVWLRPKDIGGSLLNAPGTASKGLYGGTSGGVYTWLNTFTANTAAEVIPEQTMAEEAAVIHLGAIDPVEVPKCNAITFTIAGVSAPAQSLPFNIRQTFSDNSVPFVRFEKPIIIGPEKKQKVEVMPNISGDSKFQLLSFLIAKAESLTA
ncbi:MAG: hypothetical protein DRI26_01100 [Chloroflexi bacterium]|nr:MAG: hypothetical protein DRI26_01100 [Chloroflexota bacterium]